MLAESEGIFAAPGGRRRPRGPGGVERPWAGASRGTDFTVYTAAGLKYMEQV